MSAASKILKKLAAKTAKVEGKLGVEEAKHVLAQFDTVEKATSISGKDKQRYLDALETVYGPREARAKDLGFGDKTVFHGSPGDIKQFKTGAAANKNNEIPFGAHFTENAGLASQFADNKATGKNVGAVYPVKLKKETTLDAKKSRIFEGEPSYDEFVSIADKRKGPDVYHSNSEYNGGVGNFVLPDSILNKLPPDSATKKLTNRGYDSVDYDATYRAGPLGSGAPIKDPSTVMLKPENIRSTNASFDPRFKKSSNILAGAAGLTAAGTVTLGGNNDAEASMGGAAKKIAAGLAKKSEPALKLVDDVVVDKVRAKQIAKAYDTMKHAPDAPEVKKSYDALIKETTNQFKELRAKGLKVSKIEPGMENPYKSSADMFADIEKNNHLYYFPTEQGFGSGASAGAHPMLAKSGAKIGDEDLLANDVFRIVHDYNGHSVSKRKFGAKGEEGAWRDHMKMYSPDAQKALTTETRGQNSWVNFGPNGDFNRANPAKTVYADQKAGLLPDWARDVKVEEGVPVVHYGKPGLTEIDPNFAGSATDEQKFMRSGKPHAKTSSFYDFEDKAPEGTVLARSGDQKYSGRIQGSIYDFAADPENYMGKAQQAIAQGYNGPAVNATDLAKLMAKDAGHSGISWKMDKGKPIYESFNPVSVRPSYLTGANKPSVGPLSAFKDVAGKIGQKLSEAYNGSKLEKADNMREQAIAGAVNRMDLYNSVTGTPDQQFQGVANTALDLALPGTLDAVPMGGIVKKVMGASKAIKGAAKTAAIVEKVMPNNAAVQAAKAFGTENLGKVKVIDSAVPPLGKVLDETMAVKPKQIHNVRTGVSPVALKAAGT